MSNPVVVSSGTVTIQSDSFNSMSNLYAPEHQLTEFGSYTYVPGTVVPPPAGIGETLVFPSSPTAAVNVDPNYGIVLIDSAGTLTGGGAYTTIISGASELDYTGRAGQVIALGGASNVDALNGYASVVFGGIGNKAVLAGAQSTLTLDNGSTGNFTVMGAASAIVDGSLNAGSNEASAGAGASTAGGVSTFTMTVGNQVTLADTVAGDSAYVVLNGSGNTVNAEAGTSTILASAGGDLYVGSGSAATLFVGATGSVAAAVSTIFGGGGNTTVFGQAGVVYTEGSGNNLYVGGIASVLASDGVGPVAMVASTITATTGNDTVFSGTVGTILNIGQGSEIFVGGGGSDTLIGGSVAPTVFGAANEDVKLLGTATGAILVASGAADTIDASQASQHSAFFVSNAVGNGDTTLLGSLAAPATVTGAGDLFIVSSVAGAAAVAHTITIENFHTHDAVFLSGYGAADDAAFSAAIAASTPAGSLSVTLSDNTTIDFIGRHPTTTFNGGTVAT